MEQFSFCCIMMVEGEYLMKNSENKEKKCEYCGKSFLQKRSNQKYCSDKCRSKINNERLKNKVYEYKCPNCGKEFSSKVKLKESFCKEECKNEYKYKENLRELTEDLNDNLERRKDNLAKNVIWDMVKLIVSKIISESGDTKSVFGRSLNYWNLSDIPKDTKEFVLQRDEYKCKVCGRNTNLHIHHKTKRIDGGDHSPSNLVTLCASCHRYVETFDVDRATKGCYKNALKYYNFEEKEQGITFGEIRRELLDIYHKCKNDEKTEVLYKISVLLDKLENIDI